MTRAGKVSWAHAPRGGCLAPGGVGFWKATSGRRSLPVRNSERQAAGSLGTLFPRYVTMQLWGFFPPLTPLISYLFI